MRNGQNVGLQDSWRWLYLGTVMVDMLLEGYGKGYILTYALFSGYCAIWMGVHECTMIGGRHDGDEAKQIEGQ